jgi:hypothetical protein
MAASLLCSSFTPNDDETKPKGSFYATLDGKTFQLKNDELFRGLLITKPGTMDGRLPARIVISANFNANPDDNDVQKIFPQSIQVEIDYASEKTSTPANYSLNLKCQLTDYYSLQTQSKLSATQLSWDADRKHFYISADFDCKMRSLGYPADGKSDISLKGRMANIRITVPTTLAQKI